MSEGQSAGFVMPYGYGQRAMAFQDRRVRRFRGGSTLGRNLGKAPRRNGHVQPALGLLICPVELVHGLWPLDPEVQARSTSAKLNTDMTEMMAAPTGTSAAPRPAARLAR